MKTRELPAFDPNAFLKLKCPLCEAELERRKISTAETWLKAVLGALLAPFLVGFYIIHRAYKTRREVYSCPSCGRTN